MYSVENPDILYEKLREEFNFFKTLSDAELSDFLSFCETRRVEEKDTLWKEGDSDSYAAFIISGKLGIKKKTEFDKYMIVGTFANGTVVGELCLLLEQKPRSVTAVVLEAVDLIILSSSRFEALVEKNPHLGLKLLKHIFLIISKRLTRSTGRIASIF